MTSRLSILNDGLVLRRVERGLRVYCWPSFDAALNIPLSVDTYPLVNHILYPFAHSPLRHRESCVPFVTTSCTSSVAFCLLYLDLDLSRRPERQSYTQVWYKCKSCNGTSSIDPQWLVECTIRVRRMNPMYGWGAAARRNFKHSV